MVSYRAMGFTACSVGLWMVSGLTACSPANEGGGTDTDVPAGGASATPILPGSPVAPGTQGAGGTANTPTLPGANTEGNVVPGGISTGANVPCDIAAIVSEHCTTCHAGTPKFNAPMALTSVDAFSAAAPITSTEPVRSVAKRRINAEGAARMPPPGTVGALEPTELAALNAWLDSGAPSVAQGGCSITDASVLPGGTEELLPRPSATGTELGPYEGWDEDGVECYPFVTYQPGQGDKDTPFRVGTVVDKYMGFGFKPPWQGTRFVRAFRAIIDNDQVLHHWILFEEAGAADGNVAEILGAHPGGAMMHGWAPGGTDLFFTPDLGMRMEGDSTYLLEVHYNSNDPNAVDASGLEICVTEEPPENEAIISWLGTDAISGTSSSGTCAPRASEPIHIVGATPHMHLKGAHMKVTLERASGASEVVHDEPFSFENQRGYSKDVMVQPGDRLTTTCTYNAPATFGKGTNEEMCYWFAMAYPAGALTDGGLIGFLTHGANACLGR